jgi:protocatechuate 3,4-dioxygenase beta subunit
MTRRTFFALLILVSLAAGNSFAQEKQTQEKQAPEKQTMISGVVQGADAKPLAKARVYLQPSDGRAPHTALTDADGRYQFTKLRPGLYDLRAQSNGKWTDLQRNVNVHANEEVTVNLSFMPPAKP